MRRLRLLLPFAAMLVVAPATPPAGGRSVDVDPYRAGDKSITALNILPPGQGGYMNSSEFLESQGSGEVPDHFTDQRELYAKLISEVGKVRAGTLTDYFKDASFGVKPDDIARQYSPRPGVEVIRDKGYNVPHVYGKTRADTIFGAGYVSAEDRLFMMDVLRHTGRGRLSELVGPSQANITLDCGQFRVADYTEAELQAMLDEIPAGTDQALAAQVKQDLLDYTAGINAYIEEASSDPSKLPAEYGALQIVPEAWKPTDTVAVASLIGGQLGVGGGGELGNATFLNALRAAGHSAAASQSILDDLRLVDDPEAPTTTQDAFPWNTNLGPVDADSVAMPDAGSLVDENEVVTDSCSSGAGGSLPRTIDGPLGPINLRFPSGASNALLVGSKLSKSGRPLAVFGPQVGYWSPEILLELDLHGPGIHARGVGFPGISLYVLLGRGDEYGYSATSADGDQVDIRAVRLCEPGGGTPTIESTHYVRSDGQCTPIEMRSQTWTAKPTAGSCTDPQEPGCLPQEITIRTERVQLAGIPGSVGLRGGKYGLIQARGTVNGEPVAFARQRVTYGGEVDSALTYVEMMNPEVINGAADFQRAFSRFNFTFNWFYVDGEDIAYQLGGVHPLRARGTDPDLPVWDSARWAWTRPLSFQGTPKDTSPAKGWLTSWNNKQAPGFRAADNVWGFSPVDRVLPLNDGIEAADNDDGKVDLPELVRVMGDAATVDLRGYKLVPLILEVLGDAGSERLRSVVSLLRSWSASGAHRRDENGDGEYEHQAAIAVMDEWWPLTVGAIFGPTFGSAFDSCWKRPRASTDPPCPLPYTIDDGVSSRYDQSPDQDGSSFNDGFYGHVQKDLRSLLGRSVRAPFARRYCGGGDVSACRTALLTSLDRAVTAVETRQGTTEPGEWDVGEGEDQIAFTGVGVSGIPPIPWQNRPTFQQVLEFRGGGGGGSCPGIARDLKVIAGTPEADILVGTKGRDLICGFGGRDRIRGVDGSDRLFGGGGRDRIRGGKGRDLLEGGPDKDRMNGGPARDTCRGGAKDRATRCERGRR